MVPRKRGGGGLGYWGMGVGGLMLTLYHDANMTRPWKK